MARYPIGQQDFGDIRKEGFTYVDKTQFIIKLLEGNKYYFLARPRRFGKSLFLSTLEYFFNGEKELFSGLAIDRYSWDWQPYPVIHIDLGIRTYTDPDSLLRALQIYMERYEDRFGIIPSPDADIYERFFNLVNKAYIATGKKVVVLVDEYEKPVIDNIDNPGLFEAHRDILRGFYSVLKASDASIRLVFLTGITKFGQMNVFSGLNNLRDISMSEEFSTICGITEEELKENFREGIQLFSEKRNLTYDEVLQLLKSNYDGYHFNGNCPDIYNPYSLINAFADLWIRPYWSITGTPSLLAKILKLKSFNLEKLDGAKISEGRLIGTDLQFDDPLALFYLTGYLTIKRYNEEERSYVLGYPNREVEEAFFNYLLPNYSGINKTESESYIDQLYDGFEGGDPAKAMDVLQEFSKSISYDVIPKLQSERQFQYLVYILCKLLSSRKSMVAVEQKTSDGRIDLLIETGRYVYIIELKFNGNAREALAQIERKNYGLPYRNDTREVFAIGINYSSDEKCIDDFIINHLS